MLTVSEYLRSIKKMDLKKIKKEQEELTVSIKTPESKTKGDEK